MSVGYSGTPANLALFGIAIAAALLVISAYLTGARRGKLAAVVATVAAVLVGVVYSVRHLWPSLDLFRTVSNLEVASAAVVVGLIAGFALGNWYRHRRRLSAALGIGFTVLSALVILVVAQGQTTLDLGGPLLPGEP